MPYGQPVKGETISRFLTLGGASVELYAVTFQTRTDYRGNYHPEGEPWNIEGHNWACQGCGVIGRDDPWRDRGYRYLDEARKEANKHAGQCRSMSARGAEEQPEKPEPPLRRGWLLLRLGKATLAAVPRDQ